MRADLKDALTRAAPGPDRGPDIDAIVRGGKHMRVRRRIAFTIAGAAVVLLAALVAPNVDSLLSSEDRGQPGKRGERVAPKKNGQIAFVRAVPIPGEPAADYNTTLNLVDPDGRSPEVVLEDVVHRGIPAWSPDGSRLAALAPFALNIVDVATGEVQEIPWCEDCGQPTWSPDGTRLIFSGRREGQDGLWTVRQDGTGLQLVRAGDFEMATPHWSPDGRLVAIVDTTDEPEATRDRILLLDIEGGADPAPIEPNLPGYREGFGFIQGLGWAPEGHSIVFDAHMDRGGGGILVADVETGDQDLVVTCGGNCQDFHPVFSPDGEQVAFTRVSGIEFGTDGFVGDVMVVEAGGGEPRSLTGRRGLDCCPAWQPLPR